MVNPEALPAKLSTHDTGRRKTIKQTKKKTSTTTQTARLAQNTISIKKNNPGMTPCAREGYVVSVS